MFSAKILQRWMLISLIVTYILISIGGLVRVSGSGMGCPDWPTCFGRLIPPTNIEQLSWKPNIEYNIGDMIIRNDTLWVSDFNFNSSNIFAHENWHSYEKHNYAIFNPNHTWMEYFNRLFGVLTGLIITITMLIAFFQRKKYSNIFIASVIIFLLTLIEGWIGAKVVESHLASFIITIHLLFALVIVSLQMYAYMKIKLSIKSSASIYYDSSLPSYIKILWLVTVFEILLGAHMREGIETLSKAFPNETSDFLLTTLGAFKYLHTGMGISLLILTALIWNKVMMKSTPGDNAIIFSRILISLFVFQVFMGELMVFVSFSPYLRLLHMWGASISISIIIGLYMIINDSIRKNV